MDRYKAFKIETIYKLCACAGTLIVFFSAYFGWKHIEKLEPEAIEVFERRILSSLDLESLAIQQESLQRAINESQSTGASAVDYSPEELQTLQQEADALETQIREQAKTVVAVEGEKTSLINELKITLAVSILALVAGMVFAIFGFVAWYFHIQILADRRAEPRE